MDEAPNGPMQAVTIGTGKPAGVRRHARQMADPISAGLKALWADIEKEPVPDDFLALLDEIDAARAEGNNEPREEPAS